MEDQSHALPGASVGASEPRRRSMLRRITKACDYCKARKVKCVYSGGPLCDTCLEFEVSCTFHTPALKRGPKARSRHSRPRIQSSASEPSEPPRDIPSVERSERSDHYSPGQTPSTIEQFDLEQLAPLPVIRGIVDDWFELIFSLCPILHRATFLKRLSDGEANSDPTFGALVLSICAATIASLKRKRLYEYAVSPEQCIELADKMGFFKGRKMVSLERCQALYNFGIGVNAMYGLDNSESYIHISEAAAGLKWLAYYQLSRMSTINQELLKRTFWICFAAVCTSDLHGRPSIGLLTSQSSIRLLKPSELTDAELDPASVVPMDLWHGDQMSYIPGLNFLSKLFTLWYHSQMDGNNETITQLQYHTNLVRCALDWLPPELQWRGGLSRTRGNFGTNVQTANLYITQLHIRHNLLEQMKALSKHDGGEDQLTPRAIIDERQSIVDDMLEILTHMPQQVLESNGFSLLPKIRDIGSSLLEDRRAGEWQDANTPEGHRNLERLLEILQSLDPADPADAAYLATPL